MVRRIVAAALAACSRAVVYIIYISYIHRTAIHQHSRVTNHEHGSFRQGIVHPSSSSTVNAAVLLLMPLIVQGRVV